MRSTYNQKQLLRTNSIAKIIGDFSNILILYELMNFGEKSFNELKRMTGVNAVTLSKKLHALKQESLVDSRECGNENHYYTTKNAEPYKPLIKDIESLVINN